MTRQRAVIGLALLCAFTLSAFAAPNAVALGTTAFTCEPAPKGGVGFEDEHCTKAVKSGAKFQHSEIKPGTKTQITITNNETGEKGTNTNFKSTIGGIQFELSATGAMSCPGKTSFENRVGKQMEAAGGGCSTFSGVTVLKPAKCSVKGGEIKLNEGIEGKTVVNGAEMYGELLPPAASKVFAEFILEGAECALKGFVIKVTGSARANVTTEEGKLDGPTVRYTTAETQKTLKVGANSAALETLTTVRMAPEGANPENPVVVTTTAS